MAVGANSRRRHHPQTRLENGLLSKEDDVRKMALVQRVSRRVSRTAQPLAALAGIGGE
jgi:hypothetical protein